MASREVTDNFQNTDDRLESMETDLDNELQSDLSNRNDILSEGTSSNPENEVTASDDEFLGNPNRGMSSQQSFNPDCNIENTADVVLEEMADLCGENFSLQETVDRLIKVPSWAPDAVSMLKKGLCIKWMKNNFNCSIQRTCKYEHDVHKLFKKKLKCLPSNSILKLIIGMSNDIFFKDILMEGFEILKNRKNSERYLPLISFIPFYLKDLTNTDLIEFWDEAAQYFMKELGSNDKIDGFAHLLKIYRLVDKSNQVKIIQFLVVSVGKINHATSYGAVLRSFGVTMNWKLLEPVIEFKIPILMLIEAVTSCNITKVHIDEVFEQIIPRIVIKDLPVHGLETLLQFSETLEADNKPWAAIFLQNRLRFQVLNLAPEIDENSTPRTYSYYRKLAVSIITRNKVDDEEDKKVEAVLRKDEERLRGSSPFPPPPHCQFNEPFFMTHKTLPSKLENRKKSSSDLQNRKVYQLKSLKFSVHIYNVIEQIKSQHFTLAGKSLNRFHADDCLEAAKKILETILSMKIQGDDVVQFIKRAVLTCDSKNSVVIISAVAMTLIYLYLSVDDPDWETAYKIFKTCEEQYLDVSLGEIFPMKANGNEISLSRPQKILLLIEICICSNKFIDAHQIIKKFNLWTAESCSHLNFNEKENSSRDRFVKQILESQAVAGVKAES